MRNPNSLSSRNILLQEDDCAEPRMSMRYARLRQRDLHHTGVNTTRRLLSGYDAICRHAPTRPLEGGKAGLRYCGRTRGRIPFRVRRDSDLLLAPSWTLPADGTGNGAGRSWPGRRGYRKPICATVFATAAGSRARSPSCGQCEKSLRSSSICALAGLSATTSFADGEAKATGFSGPRTLHSRPSGGTAIAARSSVYRTGDPELARFRGVLPQDQGKHDGKKPSLSADIPSGAPVATTLRRAEQPQQP